MSLNYEKPVWNCTIREFLDIQKKEIESQFKELFAKAVNEIKSEQPPQEDTISLEEAEKVTGFKKKSIYTKVSRLEMPCIARGRPLMFSRAELQLWMKLGKPTIVDMEMLKRKGRI